MIFYKHRSVYMDDLNNIDVEIEPEQTQIQKTQAKRQRMCNQILELETRNINKTNKISDAEMARKIVSIIEGNM